ncbi:MAG: glycerophosphodiester phosphodiesterase family protein, partial [Christensenellales bacterium]
MEQAQSKTKKAMQQNIEKSTESKTKKDTTKTESKTTKKDMQKSFENKTTKDVVKKEYFGHKEDEDIWQSFLVNKLIAHRGVHDKDVPENSLLAFQKAIEKGYAIELDVNPLADGTPVVFHDSKMSRMTGKDKYIQNLTKEELSQITLLNSTEKIPTLKEVLKFVNG